jgi:hypothetical protein
MPLGDTLRRVFLDREQVATLPNLEPLDPGQVLRRLRSMGFDPLGLRWAIEDCKIESNWHLSVDD